MLRQPFTRLATAARPALAPTLTTRLSTRYASRTSHLPERPDSNARRTFTSLPTLRPSLAPTAITRPTPLAPTASTPTMANPDLVAQTAISAHPAFMAAQVRCGPRNTMQANSRLKRKRKFGFLSRNKTKKGRKTLLRRREKGRFRLSN